MTWVREGGRFLAPLGMTWVPRNDIDARRGELFDWWGCWGWFGGFDSGCAFFDDF